MKAILRTIALSTLLVSGTAHAMQEAAWDFRGNVPEGMTPQQLTTVQVAEQGMYVQTETDGLIVFPPPGVDADVVTITLTNVATPNMALLWRTADMAGDEYYQKNVPLPIGSQQEAVIDLDTIGEWDASAPVVGFAFPAGSEVLIETITWRSYSPAEEFLHGIASFWTPDSFKMYSINFLWGPLISSSPEVRATMFDELPPRAWSATRVFYGIFALAFLAAIAARFADRERGPARMKAILLATGVALWIVFDLRMTQEIVGYAARDWSTYVTAPEGERTLRSHSGLYDVLDTVDELLGDDGQYVLLARDGTPFFANVRYTLYPAVPVGSGANAWIVLGMPGVTIVDGAITGPDGTPLSPKGSVVKRFDETSFFFRAP